MSFRRVMVLNFKRKDEGMRTYVEISQQTSFASERHQGTAAEAGHRRPQRVPHRSTSTPGQGAPLPRQQSAVGQRG